MEIRYDKELDSILIKFRKEFNIGYDYIIVGTKQAQIQEALDGDQVEILVRILRNELNLIEANLTTDEFDKRQKTVLKKLK